MCRHLAHLFYLIILHMGSGLSAQDVSTALTGNNSLTPAIHMGAKDPLELAHTYIETHLEELHLTAEDVSGMTISDMYTDKSSGITRIYFLQHHQGIPVFEAILNICMTKDGRVYFVGNRFESGLAEKVNTTSPGITADDAVMRFAAHLGLPREVLTLKKQSGSTEMVFEKGTIANEDITVALSYQPCEGKVRLAWDILFAPVSSSDFWSTRVDAVTGIVLDNHNWTFYCNPDHLSSGNEQDECHEHEAYSMGGDPESQGTGPQYKVWAAPMDSPNDGPRVMLTDPADPVASPYGWHDTNGQPGAEYTNTSGNNTRVYQDRDNLGYSSNDEPDGGPDLHFDFPYDPSMEPEQYTDAAVVNLFYWINYMHDFSYRFGFDEAAGNFQKNNYGKGGIGNDFVWAVTQSGANTGLQNNAGYHHRNDGTPPTIWMFIYNNKTRYLTVNEPALVAGKYKTIVPATGWGPGAYLTDVPLTGEVVAVYDGVESPSTSDACEPILNMEELAGKIALIERGGCQFAYKALQAQNAGAIAVIFFNFETTQGNLAAGTDAINVNIPVVMLNVNEGIALREFAGNGLIVTLVNPTQNTPELLDSDLQSSSIAHEYGHGISLRLAGGPDKVCLLNAEQMGEGWCDFFALVTTVKPGDTGEKKRGIGTYLFREPETGKGHRRYPYSTDMSIAPLTYGDVATSMDVHDLGEVWANMLWDMYWAMVERHGWSDDPHNEASGNYKAVRLVMDGLKNMACNPGFTDGRDAILAADEALYNGENVCLLWEVFARRGLGYSADQGSSFDAGDQTEAFDMPPFCENKITIEKTVTDFIQAGDDIQVEIKVKNYKTETATNVVVADEMPEGTSIRPGSSNYTVIVQGHTLLFDLGNMNPGKEKIITYTLHTSPDAGSVRKFIDEVPDQNNDHWLAYTIGTAATNTWFISDTFSAHSGTHCWVSQEISQKSQQALVLNPDSYTFHADGDHPVLRFYHRYQTKAGMNGGIVEVREAGTTDWEKTDDAMLRNGYKGLTDFRTFISSSVHTFSGDNGTAFKASYVDLDPWAGKDIQIRFRFATVNDSINPGAGWMIDDIEFMDLLSYNGEVCVTTDQGDHECALAPEAGTIVDTKEVPTGTTETWTDITTRIYPNPASEMVTLALASEHQADVHVSLLTLDGRVMFAETIDLSGYESMRINTSPFPAGIYFVKVCSGKGSLTEKVVIQK